MTAQRVEPGVVVRPLDPASPEGQAVRSAEISASVIARLRREGLPVPGESDPAP